MSMNVLVVGAGLSGAVIAHLLAKKGASVSVVDSRSHVGGNCYCERDKKTGVMVHKFGPHIFHTDDVEVWDFIRKFGDFRPFINRVKTTSKGRIYSLPINLHTINQFYGQCLAPLEAREWIQAQADNSISEPANFEEQALKFVGKEIYDAFFKGYTIKQWGIDPKDLPASILKRLPVRFSYDDNYFFHKYQGIPTNGYTELVAKMLSHSNITVQLDTNFSRSDAENYDHVFYSGAIDGFYNYELGRLKYRTLEFERIELDGDYQGCAVMNYADENVSYTRIAEHKHFAPWEVHSQSVAFREYSKECKESEIPYYPIRLSAKNNLLEKYIAKATNETNVTFVGRLGTYRYLDMDVSIREAMNTARAFSHEFEIGAKHKIFYVDVD